MIKKTDEAGYSTIYHYDALNRLVGEIDALNRKTSYEYDPVGKTTRLTNPKGDSYQYKYDNLDRLVKEVKSKAFKRHPELRSGSHYRYSP